jgi:stage II sporulation protein M
MKKSETIIGEKKYGLCVCAMILLIVGVSAGSVYLVSRGDEMGEGIKSFIGEFFSSLPQSDKGQIFKNSLISNLMYLIIIFAAGFFRLGFVVTGALLVRKGFVIGFTAASFFKFYGMKGMLVMLSTMPSALITVPSLMFFSALSVKFSVNPDKRQKKLIFLYIFSLILLISIFCVAALSEGYLTTTFMTWLSPKIN